VSDVDDLFAPGYLDALQERTTDEVRAMRTHCVDVETGYSYLRRMVQGRADIVANERRERADGGHSSALPELIGQLPEILSEHRRPGGSGRLPQSLDPPEPDAELSHELEQLASAGKLAAIGELTDSDIDALAAALNDLEERVSQQRRRLFGLIDALQAELTRRYKSGEANVESLLS
jgi:hypothetical protein